ncbi:putative positive effector of YfiN activity, OM lipoprotein [Herbaspirillum sp. BH-1]|jgi:outer membrane protein OmpA-like peptidoglycan-associated protein|uniref:Outer membrane protein OmpA-like peptidoglycan-associated protein n=1 Tax=Herbaspirillum frisingense TaxID=92645 RepID=A0ABU1PH76_9BURK|nr:MULTISPECIES: OmpA family protein [Herbaspirillum]MDR6585135.1 outer membrane protein OmpA-like peptidoglycan-associated protein [Herbaspirillum frisingense]PLY60992.1 putative positive effector of YfiN activity, OM lipoprotein [Herbaspirillum sp. BH-1]
MTLATSSLSSRLLAAMLLGSTLLLSGCQTPPPAAPQAGLTQSQVALLQQQGFHLTDEGWELSFADKLLFAVDDYALTEQSRTAVGKIGRALLSVDITELRVDGHTDNTGADAYNNRLSQQRADAVADALASIGIARDHIATRGLGKSKPIADNRTVAGRAENRRVVIVVPAQ